VAALAGLIAHGGLAGAIAESFVAISVAAVLIAIWIRERRARGVSDGPARLRDEGDP
jgi:hypothetical protein